MTRTSTSQLSTLSPLFRHSVGFDRFNDLFETMLQSDSSNASTYPPYNILRTGEDQYRIVMAVAGFDENDINITQQQNELTISGMIKDEEDDAIYLHRGIAARAFERKFSLADHMQVTSADLRQGLLTVELKLELPEEAKPRMIPVKGEPKSIENKTSSSKKKTN